MKIEKTEILPDGKRRLWIRAEGGDQALPDVLVRNGIFLPMDCGGRGVCGKCRVRFLEGAELPGPMDEQVLRPEELTQGWRLGCQCRISRDCLIEINRPAEEQIRAAGVSEQAAAAARPDEKEKGSCGQAPASFSGDHARYAAAVDIGSTTIAMCLVDRMSGKILSQYRGLNHQRSYGADVVSRIKASMDGSGDKLQKLICTDLARGLAALRDQAGGLQAKEIYLAGNMAMIHLLLGADCEGLAAYPFYSDYLDGVTLQAQSLPFLEETGYGGSRVQILPGISPFVGADILAGLYACGYEDYIKEERDDIHLFLDLGTNAEMAAACGGRILVDSASAGPVFEGGSISCGCAGIPGAISSVRIQGGLVRPVTIGGAKAVGLCGSGLISCVSELLRGRLMDRTGALRPRFRNGVELVPGRLYLTQEDIRQFQQAKAAVRAGLDTLAAEAARGCRQEPAGSCGIQTAGNAGPDGRDIYLDLAGGFGLELDVDAAVRTGLLPKLPRDRIKPRGNSCLTGLIRLIREGDRGSLSAIRQAASEIYLSNNEYFTEHFLEEMNF